MIGRVARLEFEHVLLLRWPELAAHAEPVFRHDRDRHDRCRHLLAVSPMSPASPYHLDFSANPNQLVQQTKLSAQQLFQLEEFAASAL